MLITYKKINNKYTKNDKPISKKKVYEELNKYKINQLETTLCCKIRDTSIKCKTVSDGLRNDPSNIKTNTNTCKNIKISKKEQRLAIKNAKILKEVKNSYAVHRVYYKYQDRHTIELYRKNPKGYYNFVVTLENDLQETVDSAIIDDYYKQKELKVKRSIIYETDDI